MGVKLSVYLNNKYTKMFNYCKKKLQVNNTDVIRIALSLLYNYLKEKEKEEINNNKQ